MKKINADGINVMACSENKACELILNNTDRLRGKYITFVNLFSLACAREDKCYKKAQRGAALSFADGFPIAFYQVTRGVLYAKRVAGPDLMKRIISKTASGKDRHFFLGGNDESLEMLKTNLGKEFPLINIAGTLDPGPVPKLSDGEPRGYDKGEKPKETGRDEINKLAESLAEKINEAAPDYLWVGLGTPKQEYIMEALKGKVNCVMFGVGAAFDFLAGTKKRAPKSLQLLHLEWLYRLISEPGRLLKRYIKCAFELPFLFFG